MGFLPGVGTTEMIIVGIIALLLFGRNLPNVARNMGKSFGEFKKGLSGFQDEFRNVTREAERSVEWKPEDTKKSTLEDRPKADPEEASAESDFEAPRFDLS